MLYLPVDFVVMIVVLIAGYYYDYFSHPYQQVVMILAMSLLADSLEYTLNARYVYLVLHIAVKHLLKYAHHSTVDQNKSAFVLPTSIRNHHDKQKKNYNYYHLI